MNTKTDTEKNTDQDVAPVEEPAAPDASTRVDGIATPQSIAEPSTAGTADEPEDGWEPVEARPSRRWLQRVLVVLIVLAAAAVGAATAAAFMKSENEALLEGFRQLGVEYKRLSKDYALLEGEVDDVTAKLNKLAERDKQKADG